MRFAAEMSFTLALNVWRLAFGVESRAAAVAFGCVLRRDGACGGPNAKRQTPNDDAAFAADAKPIASRAVPPALCPPSASLDDMSDDPSLPPEPDDSAARDLALMARVKHGDTDAFRELIETHQHRVIGTVARMLGDESDAEDIAQVVFVRVWKSAPRYEPAAKFTTWLFKIVRNLVFNELRRRKRHPTQSLDATENPDDRPHQFPDPGVKPADTALLDAEMQAAIQRAIDALPEAQRLAVILRRYDETPYEEIAEVLDLTVPAVKSLLFRARTELREKLRQYLDA